MTSINSSGWIFQPALDSPSLVIQNFSINYNGREFLAKLTRNDMLHLENYLHARLRIGNWISVKVSNVNNKPSETALDLAEVVSNSSLKLSKGLPDFLSLSPGSSLNLWVDTRFSQKASLRMRTHGWYIARLKSLRETFTTVLPQRIMQFLYLKRGSPIEIHLNGHSIVTEVCGRGRITLPKETSSPVPIGPIVTQQIYLQRLSSDQVAFTREKPYSIILERQKLDGRATWRGNLYLALNRGERATLRLTHGTCQPGDYVHGQVSNPTVGVESTLLTPITTKFCINFRSAVAKHCGLEPGKPVRFKVSEIIPKTTVGKFSKPLPFDVNVVAYPGEARIHLPKPILKLYNLKSYYPLQMILAGRRCIYRLTGKRIIVLMGRNRLGLSPGSHKLVTIQITNIGQRECNGYLQRLARKHKNLKKLFQELVNDGVVPGIQAIDEIEPRYAIGPNSHAQPDFRVVLKDGSLANVEVKAYHSQSGIGSKSKSQFKMYSALSLPLILVTTVPFSHIAVKMQKYFTRILALEDLEKIIRRAAQPSYGDQLAEIVEYVEAI
ncbi:MAG: hypothetical protein ACE5OZ_04125 [Candidatus Heimdallarchaeota archaeon]